MDRNFSLNTIDEITDELRLIAGALENMADKHIDNDATKYAYLISSEAVYKVAIDMLEKSIKRTTSLIGEQDEAE